MEVTGGFLLLAAWLNYLDGQGIVPLALLSCALHEGGHLLALRALGVGVRRMSVTAVGAELEVERPLSYGGELLAALAGPAVNLVLALVFCAFPWGWVFSGINLVLCAFNLLPIGGMDGGRALRCLLCWLLGPEAAWAAGRWLDRLLVLALVALGGALVGMGAGPTLLLTALWLCSNLVRCEREEKRPLRRRLRRRGGAG